MARLQRLIVIGLPLLVAAVLLRSIDHDPARGVTISNAPFTDEAWRLLNARDFTLFGTWATDDWVMHLVQVPMSVVQAVVFAVAGVGLVQARLISVVATVAMAIVLVVGLRRSLGLAGALTAAAAASLSTLTLYYSRLALLEPSIACALSIAAVAAIRADRGTAGRWAVVCGVALAVAVGLKATTLAPALGILAAVTVRSYREPDLRRFPIIAGGVVLVAASGWYLAVAIQNGEALRRFITVLPTDTVPGSLMTWLGYLRRYPWESDGLIPLALPLLVAAVVGLGVVVWSGRNRSPWQWSVPLSGPTLVALIGAGWVTAGIIGVASFDYRPNRYALPILPGLGLLAGAGVAVMVSRLERYGRLWAAAIPCVVVALLVVPGLVTDAQWHDTTGRTALDGQAAIERILPAGAAVAGGYAPLFAMRLPVQTVVPFKVSPVNDGDQYAAGVRWAFVTAGEDPVWAGAHPEAWAARVEHWCTPWGKDWRPVCLVELP